MFPRLLATAFALGVAGSAGAQTAMFAGTIYRVSAGHRLPATEVVLPDLKRGVTSNYLGEFKLDRLPPGRHALIIRHVGFAPLLDTLVLAAGARIDTDFVLTEQPVALDSVRVVAKEKT